MGDINWRPAMASMYMVIVGWLYFGIVRGRNLSFKGRLTFWKPMKKKQGVPFYRTGSPFDMKRLYVWLVLGPVTARVGDNFRKEWVHWVSTWRRIIPSSPFRSFSAFSPPRSLQL